jgi:hypothetical protein
MHPFYELNRCPRLSRPSYHLSASRRYRPLTMSSHVGRAPDSSDNASNRHYYIFAKSGVYSFPVIQLKSAFLNIYSAKKTNLTNGKPFQIIK